MSVRKSRIVRDVLFVIGFIIMMLGEPFGWGCFIVGAIVFFSGLIPHVLYNRCPHCGKSCGHSSGNYCQFCGKKLEL